VSYREKDSSYIYKTETYLILLIQFINEFLVCFYEQSIQF